jgi:transcriptional regulator with XRE-family HTH domain
MHIIVVYRMNDSDFSINLKYLCGYYRSVTDVCRRIGINRQQFSKYLGGTSEPSRFTLRKICDFFGVEEYEILLPPSDFRDLIAVRPRQSERGPLAPLPPYVEPMEGLFSASRAETSRYLGYYFSYRFSFSVPDLVLKSVVRFWKVDERVISKRIERFFEDDGHGRNVFLLKYDGYLMFLRDRIYIVENDTLHREEISETILYPGYRNNVSWLSGLNLGVSTSDDRRIGCGRVLYQYLGRDIDIRTALRSSGRHNLNSDEIPETVVEQLSPARHGSTEAFLFARPR